MQYLEAYGLPVYFGKRPQGVVDPRHEFLVFQPAQRIGLIPRRFDPAFVYGQGPTSPLLFQLVEAQVSGHLEEERGELRPGFVVRELSKEIAEGDQPWKFKSNVQGLSSDSRNLCWTVRRK